MNLSKRICTISSMQEAAVLDSTPSAAPRSLVQPAVQTFYGKAIGGKVLKMS